MKPLILLVEDNPTDEKLTLRAFAKCVVPVDVVVSHDGVEAIDYLLGAGRHSEAAPPLLPDLVLLDLKLPRIDGLEVIRRIRGDERVRLVPIVVLTASREEEDIVESRTLGANAYVRKPVDFTQFVETVNIVAQFWLRMNEPMPKRRASV